MRLIDLHHRLFLVPSSFMFWKSLKGNTISAFTALFPKLISINSSTSPKSSSVVDPPAQNTPVRLAFSTRSRYRPIASFIYQMPSASYPWLVPSPEVRSVQLTSPSVAGIECQSQTTSPDSRALTELSWCNCIHPAFELMCRSKMIAPHIKKRIRIRLSLGGHVEKRNTC